jgi:ectoine hydroxylase-related dioxygenase (phytanoyl-CoA dioxygenase family)
MALLPAFQSLVHEARLLDVVSALLGRAVAGARGSVCRLAPPERLVAATPPHRDADYLQDSRGIWGAWIPLADCSVADGVLAAAPGSHHGDDSAGFAAADLRLGDVLLLSAQTRHRACPNLRAQRVRLSMDLRFGPAGV